jgi:hypothetical protein
VKITKNQIRRTIREELYHGSLINLNRAQEGHHAFRGDTRLFERSYVTGVLGISLPLQEAYPYSAVMERRIIYEQMQYENWWGEDWDLFEGAYGQLLKIYSPGELIDLLEEGASSYEMAALLHEGPLDWAGDLLKKGYRKGKETVEKGIEAGKEALLSAKEGIAKFGKGAWNILSAMWLVMKGGAKEIGTWTMSVAKKGINKMYGKIQKVLQFLWTPLQEWWKK